MEIINFTELRNHCKEVMDQSWQNRETVLVTRSNGQHMVMLPYTEYEALTETQYLLQNEHNREHLRQSLKSAKAGRRKAWVLPDED